MLVLQTTFSSDTDDYSSLVFLIVLMPPRVQQPAAKPPAPVDGGEPADPLADADLADELRRLRRNRANKVDIGDKFSGAAGKDPAAFLRRCEIAFDGLDVEPEDRLFVVHKFFSGDASLWWENEQMQENFYATYGLRGEGELEEDQTPWTVFHARVLARFRPTNFASSALNDLMKLRCRDGPHNFIERNYTEFEQKFRRARIRTADTADATVKKYFLDALPYTLVERATMTITDATTLEECYNIVRVAAEQLSRLGNHPNFQAPPRGEKRRSDGDHGNQDRGKRYREGDGGRPPNNGNNGRGNPNPNNRRPGQGNGNYNRQNNPNNRQGQQHDRQGGNGGNRYPNGDRDRNTHRDRRDNLDARELRAAINSLATASQAMTGMVASVQQAGPTAPTNATTLSSLTNTRDANRQAAQGVVNAFSGNGSQNTNNNRPRLARLTEAERERCLRENLCFRCRLPGHTTQQCTGPN